MDYYLDLTFVLHKDDVALSIFNKNWKGSFSLDKYSEYGDISLPTGLQVFPHSSGDTQRALNTRMEPQFSDSSIDSCMAQMPFSVALHSILGF